MREDDGRAIRAAKNRADLLRACRLEMAAGNFRPTIVQVAKLAKLSKRTAFKNFTSVEKLHDEAAGDGATREQIVALICCNGGPPTDLADQLRIVRAAVTGNVF